MYEVQDGVPIPEINRAPQGARRKYPIETMKIGDMFFVEGRSSKSVSAYISRISKDVTGKFSARHCWMAKDGDGKWQLSTQDAAEAKEGTGVWRVE